MKFFNRLAASTAILFAMSFMAQPALAEGDWDGNGDVDFPDFVDGDATDDATTDGDWSSSDGDDEWSDDDVNYDGRGRVEDADDAGEASDAGDATQDYEGRSTPSDGRNMRR